MFSRLWQFVRRVARRAVGEKSRIIDITAQNEGQAYQMVGLPNPLPKSEASPTENTRKTGGGGSVTAKVTKYTVSVDDNFHYMDESERCHAGEFDTYEEALVKAKEIVDRSLRWIRRQIKDPYNPEELYDHYTDFGDDPFISPRQKHSNFSAWTYAEKRSREICRERRPSRIGEDKEVE